MKIVVIDRQGGSTMPQNPLMSLIEQKLREMRVDGSTIGEVPDIIALSELDVIKAEVQASPDKHILVLPADINNVQRLMVLCAPGMRYSLGSGLKRVTALMVKCGIAEDKLHSVAQTCAGQVFAWAIKLIRQPNCVPWGPTARPGSRKCRPCQHRASPTAPVHKLRGGTTLKVTRLMPQLGTGGCAPIEEQAA